MLHCKSLNEKATLLIKHIIWRCPKHISGDQLMKAKEGCVTCMRMLLEVYPVGLASIYAHAVFAECTCFVIDARSTTG